MGEKIRLNKLISDSGYCSRREADQFIEQGRVQVNRLVCDTKGTLARLTDRIEVDGELIRHEVRRIYIALNKPAGITCTTDLSDQTNIVDFIGHKDRIFHIGRLDKPSEGLIFMTNDGDIVNKILRAGNSHEKEYIVTVDRPITEEFLQQMRSGVRIQRGVRTLPCLVNRESGSSFRITLVQGLNRQIRRMCESLGYNVRRLIRIRIMNITLEGLSNGEWRYFTPKEIDHMNALIDESDNNRSVAKRRKKSSSSNNLSKSSEESIKVKRATKASATSNIKSANKPSRKGSESTTLRNEIRDSRKSSGSQEKGGKDNRRTSASPDGANTAKKQSSRRASAGSGGTDASKKQSKSRVSVGSGGTDASKKQSKSRVSVGSGGSDPAKKQSKGRVSVGSGGTEASKKQNRGRVSVGSGGSDPAKKQNSRRASTGSGKSSSSKFSEYRKSGSDRSKPTKK